MIAVNNKFYARCPQFKFLNRFGSRQRRWWRDDQTFQRKIGEFMSRVSQCVALLCLLMVVTFTSCGKWLEKKKEDEAPRTILLPGSSAPAKEDKVTHRDGRLRIVGNDLIDDGMVDYTMYSNGFLKFRGSVTYRLQPWNSWTITQAFDRDYQANSKTFLSATYNKIGLKHNDFKLDTEVKETVGSNLVVHTTVREEPGVLGKIEVNTKDELIDIEYAEVEGYVLGRKITVTLKKF